MRVQKSGLFHQLKSAVMSKMNTLLKHQEDK